MEGHSPGCTSLVQLLLSHQGWPLWAPQRGKLRNLYYQAMSRNPGSYGKLSKGLHLSIVITLVVCYSDTSKNNTQKANRFSNWIPIKIAFCLQCTLPGVALQHFVNWISQSSIPIVSQVYMLIQLPLTDENAIYPGSREADPWDFRPVCYCHWYSRCVISCWATVSMEEKVK